MLRYFRLCTHFWYWKFSLLNYVPYVLPCLICFVPYVLLPLVCLIPYFPLCLTCSMSWVPLCLMLPLCLVPCVLWVPISTFLLLCFHASGGILKIYFQLLSCSGKFTTDKLRIAYKFSIEMTVSINQQYDLVKLFSKKYLCC